MRVWPGKPYPLGATWDRKGVNFALFTENATSVELLLYETKGSKEPKERIPFKEKTGDIWHAYLPDLLPGQLYAYSVDGPYDPASGLRFNPHKALIDPYAKAIGGTIDWSDAIFAYRVGNKEADLLKDERDSGHLLPKCVVIDPSFDWEGDQLLRTPWSETVIYELHVKGFTHRHPEVGREAAGTYAGLASPAVVRHLKALGVTAVELMPVHQHVDDKTLVDNGLKNYWGYNTIGFFAPDCRYSSSGVLGQQVTEFKQMVKALHKAGVEVILDVVYNHTAEGSHLGPTISFRGIDNLAYYRINPENPRYYLDFTGTGNSLNVRHPMVIKLIMDSLRYWVQEMHVDGFRFDLASTLARELFEVDSLSTFFQVIQQDPVISQVKLIAEPWDVGPGGYQVGNFPHLWAEWNGKYRDTVRSFWRGDEGQLADLAYRLTGSSDLFRGTGRTPFASINFVTCHDGFTLADLVSYAQKHNEANGENNNDGSDGNFSANYGAEGPTDDPRINEIRARQRMNFLLTLLLSQGVPMIRGGDELGMTQMGNNNAYCQDNEMSWVDWDLSERAKAFLDFVRKAIHIRREHPVFRRRKFFQGEKVFGHARDLLWLQPNGSEMTGETWAHKGLHCVGAVLLGDAINEYNERGERIADDTFALLLNSDSNPVEFTLPRIGDKWAVVLKTSSSQGHEAEARSGEPLRLDGHSALLLRRVS
jgi:isoamylase